MPLKECGQRFACILLATWLGAVYVWQKFRRERMLGWIGVVEFAERDAICFGFRFRFGDGIGLADIDSGGKTHGLHHTPWVAQVVASSKMVCFRLTIINEMARAARR